MITTKVVYFFLRKNLHDERAHFYVTDIRDKEALVERMKGVDFVFHAAALKHVMLSEKSPEQVLQTNALGVQNHHAAQLMASKRSYLPVQIRPLTQRM